MKNKFYYAQSVGAALCVTVRQATGKISCSLSLTQPKGQLGYETNTCMRIGRCDNM